MSILETFACVVLTVTLTLFLGVYGCRVELSGSSSSLFLYEEAFENHTQGTKLPGFFAIAKAAKEKVSVHITPTDPIATKYTRHVLNNQQNKIEFYLKENKTLRQYREEQWQPTLDYTFEISCTNGKQTSTKSFTYVIGITDENLNSPRFEVTSYNVELTYSKSHGFKLEIVEVDSIRVVDKDFNRNFANVTITCDGASCKYFNLTSNLTSDDDGYLYDIYVKVSDAHLDGLGEEMKSRENLTIRMIASDGETKPSWADLLVDFSKSESLPPTFSEDKENASKLPIIVTGSVLLLVVLSCSATVAFLTRRGKKAKDLLRKLTEAEIREFLEGNVSLGGEGKRSVDVNTPIMALPYNHNFEIARDKLRIDETTILGTGAFGIVWKGSVVYSNGDSITVAIKTVKRNVGILYFKALLSELKIMAYIGKHPNIVSLVGACTHNIKKREVYIAVQYCANGNFHNYLKCRRDRFSNMVIDGNIQLTNIGAYSYSNKGCFSKTISTIDLLKWAIQIANGLQYLESLGVIHGDLATRNVLLDNERTAKIGDFGLSRRLIDYNNYYYTKTSQAPLPWKWMAPESLKDMRFSKKSDIWSFGIVLWEIFSLGQTPYAGLNWDETFIERLEKGMRPSKPTFASTLIYDIMADCWNLEAHDRPAVFDIKRVLENITNSALRQKGDLSYMKLMGEKKTILSLMNEDELGYLEPNDPKRRNYMDT